MGARRHRWPHHRWSARSTGKSQGWPSYRSTLSRRRSFIDRNRADQPCAPGSPGCVEVPLSGHVIHPPNYNFQGGEERRLLNVDSEGGDWIVPNPCSGLGLGGADWDQTVGPDGQITYEFAHREVCVSPGEDGIEEDEAAIDYNSLNPVLADRGSLFSWTAVVDILEG
jgi:hypothetical protein